MNRKNTIPKYRLGEEIINSVSHAIGTIISIIILILMIIKSNTNLEYITVSIFGITVILLYANSTIYHSLSKKLYAKKILRILDHCNVYLLVLGTYIPISLLGIGGTKSIVLVTFVEIITIIGITLTLKDIDKYIIISVICHLLNGWSAIIGINDLYNNISFHGLLFLVIGGIMYSVGAILYSLGSHIKYMHSIFHFFCIAGSLFHFLCLYLYIL